MIRAARLSFRLAGIILASAALAGGPGSTTGAFLKLPSGARAIAMGEAYAAGGDDIQALGWNPAGLAGVKKREFTFMHSEWVQDIRYESVAYAQPMTNFITVAGGVDFMFSGDIRGTAFGDMARGLAEGPENVPYATLAKSFSASNVVLTAGAAVDVSGMRWIAIPSVQAGMNVRALLQKIADQSANGAVVDVGARWGPTFAPNLTLALVGQNLGPSINSKGTPITMRLGAAYRLLDRNLLLDLDYYQPVDNYGRISAGAEYWYRNMLAIRGGYGFQHEADLNKLDTNGLEGLTLGCGFRYQMVQVDYAFRTEGFLGAAHRMSLTFKF